MIINIYEVSAYRLILIKLYRLQVQCSHFDEKNYIRFVRRIDRLQDKKQQYFRATESNGSFRISININGANFLALIDLKTSGNFISY